MQIVVIGCGRVGAGLARALEEAGHSVCVVDEREEALQHLAAGFSGRLVHGDPTDRRVLEEARLGTADGLAAVGDSDDRNLVLALAARRVFRVPQVVARLHDPRRAALYERLGVRTLSPIATGVRRLAQLLSPLPLAPMLWLGDVEVVEFRVPSALDGRRLEAVELEGHVRVVALTRGGATCLPTAGAVLAAEDVLTLAVSPAGAERLKEVL